jgi:hypothetical protein
MAIPAQEKSLLGPHLNQGLGTVVQICHLSYVGKPGPPGQLGYKARPYLNKRAEDLA